MDEEYLSSRYFKWPDYLIFALTLLISSLVGIYHAWRDRGRTTTDYLMGGKQMGIFPIALSLAASTLSAASMLGVPTDVYLNGTMYIWAIAALVLCIPMASYLYLPVFHQLQVVSANHYLEMRFHRFIRRLTSILYIVKMLIFISMVVYGPSLALQQVTGIDVFISVAVMFVVCTFYTSIGGIKAVVWTDAIQIFLMYGSLIAVIVKGVLDVGGFAVIWERNYNSSRLEFLNIDTDLTTQSTIWTLVIGGFFYWGAWYAVDQTIVQRFLSMPTLKKAQISMWTNVIAVAGIIALCGFIGLLIYARFYDCDPLSANLINKADQIVPLYVMETVGSWSGLPGLFVAGIFSGALSSLSSCLNAVALVVLEDFIRPFHPALTEKSATLITKGVSFGVGCVGFGMVFLIAQVKTILDAVLSLDGAAVGSIMGVFTLGMFVPWANTIGAAVGMVTSFSAMMWLGVANQMAKSQGYVQNNQLKPTTTENCPVFNVTTSSSAFNISTTSAPPISEDDVFVLLKISFWWYTLMGMIIVLVVGTLVSLITGRQDPSKLDPRLLSPILRCGSNKKDKKEEANQRKRRQRHSEGANESNSFPLT